MRAPSPTLPPCRTHPCRPRYPTPISPASTLISALGTAARIRNVAIGYSMYRDDVLFGGNVESCEDDPCGSNATFQSIGGVSSNSDGEGLSLSCVDGALGVYCPCFEATVTGEEVRGERAPVLAV